MFIIVRLALAFVLGTVTAKTIEESPVGAFFMGAVSLALIIWCVLELAKFI